MYFERKQTNTLATHCEKLVVEGTRELIEKYKYFRLIVG